MRSGDIIHGLDDDKLIMLNLVSKWCDVCGDHVKLLDNIDKKLKENFRIVIADIDDKPYLWKRFNFGGLPSIVFLSKNYELLYGYSGYTGEKILKEIFEMVLAGKTERYKLENISEDIPSQREIDESIIYKLVNMIENGYDWLYGGFLEEYKSIHFNEHLFLLNMFLETGVKGYGLMVQKTVDQISNSEMMSGEGFYRYSSNIDWSNPDKKILTEINSNLLFLYTSIYKVFRKNRYKLIADSLEKFIYRRLFNRRSNLFIRGIYDEKIYDNRIYFSINADVVEKFLKIYKLGSDKKYLKKVLKILEYLSSEKVIRHRLDYEENNYYLIDITYLLRSLLEAYEVSGDEYWIDKWIKWMKFLDNRFMNIKGAYNDIPKDTKLFGGFIKRMPIEENSLLAENMINYSYMFDDDFYRRKAYNILRYYSILFEKYGFNLGEYAVACLTYFREPPILYVYRYKRLKNKIRNILLPNFLVRWISKGSPEYVIKKKDKILKFKSSTI